MREVYSDWNAEDRGTLRIQRLDTAGSAARAVPGERIDKRYAVAAKLLTGRMHTWFAFPEWFTYKEPVNTLTVAAATPGGLTTQFSSIGHYALARRRGAGRDGARPRCAVPSHPVGSKWYVSTDYEHHQTSLTARPVGAVPGGVFRYVVSAQRPRDRQLAGDDAATRA